MKSIRFIAALLLLCASAASAQTGIYVPEMRKTDSLVKAFMQTWNVPGATVAITKDGKLIYNRAFGFANMAKTDSAKPHTLLRIASNSKAITGIAIMKLVDAGSLALSDTVFGAGRILRSPYYLGAITDARIYNITIKQLLEHTAGWDRAVPCDGFSGCDPIGFPLHVTSTMGEGNPVGDSTLIKFLLKKGLNTAPGATYAYSNIGYLVLAKVIEAKTGMSYESYVASAIMAPLGLCDIKLGKNLLADKQEREGEYTSPATTLSAYGTGAQVPWQYGGWNLEAMHAHGGFIATSADYVRMILAVDGFATVPDILTPAAITAMKTGSSANSNYAKGWSVNASGNWWHTGSLDGASAFMCRTSTGYTWALHFNTRNNAPAFYNAMDALPWNAVAQMNGVPAHNLFPPATQASGLTATSTSGTTAQLSWSAGSGDKRLVLATEAAQIGGFPTEGRSYNANAVYGIGDAISGNTYTVYYGAGTSATITGLDPAKTYRFTVMEAFENAATGNLPVYKHGCRSTATISRPASVAGTHAAGGLSLYPNPASGEVTIVSHSLLQHARIRLQSISGKTVREWNDAAGKTLVLDIHAQPAGMYFIEVSDGGAVQRLRLVKQ